MKTEPQKEVQKVQLPPKLLQQTLEQKRLDAERARLVLLGLRLQLNGRSK